MGKGGLCVLIERNGGPSAIIWSQAQTDRARRRQLSEAKDAEAVLQVLYDYGLRRWTFSCFAIAISKCVLYSSEKYVIMTCSML